MLSLRLWLLKCSELLEKVNVGISYGHDCHQILSQRVCKEIIQSSKHADTGRHDSACKEHVGQIECGAASLLCTTF